jgi:hypothetical protein
MAQIESEKDLPKVKEVEQKNKKPAGPTDKDNMQSEESEEPSDEEDEPDLASMDEETKRAYLEKQLRTLQEREAAAQKIQEYEDRLNTETLKTFKDAPDEIKAVFVVKSADDFVELSWDAPDDNNSKIVEYTIYLSDKVIYDIGSPDLSI